MWYVIGIVVILLVVIISIYNSIMIAKIKVEEGLSGIDVALSKRYDTLINLVEVVKGYAKHETETLEKVIEARKDMSIKEKANIGNQYVQTQSKLFAIAEGYPDLKANTNFLQLQNSIVDVEEHLQAARRLYNANVASYNEKLVVFPSNMIASMMNESKVEYFQTDEESKNNVSIAI